MATDYYKGTTVLTVVDSLLMTDRKTPHHKVPFQEYRPENKRLKK
jgi:hypothetical protein